MKINSPKIKAKLTRVILITIAWTFAAMYARVIQFISIKYIAGSAIPEEYTLINVILHTFSEVIIPGLIVASLDVFYFTDRFKKKSFSYAVLMKTLFYTICLIVVTYTVYIIESRYFDEMHRFLWKNVSAVIILNFSVWSVIFLLTEFILQVSDKYGKGVLLNFIMGKYHKPKEEIRIFMFLDIKSSTSIAEALGNLKYFQMLNDFFYDVTDSVLETKGEIYQYVGDEVVISWQLKNGIENENCLNCFFLIYDMLEKASDKYRDKYGLVPTFKTGVHFGLVSVGEIGVSKREITFSGDVLNTTSRIQELCNRYDRKLIVSKDLLDIIRSDNKFFQEELGEMNLRGKSTPIVLFSITKKLN